MQLLHLYSYLIVILIIGLTTIVCLPLSSPQSYHIVSFILLFAVALLAVFLGIGPVLLASTMSAVAWNYFFIPPFHTFHIARTEDRLMFISFFIIALLNGILTNRIRRQERAVRDREIQTNALFQLTGGLSKARGTDEVIMIATDHFRKHFGADAWFIIQDGNNNLNHTPVATAWFRIFLQPGVLNLRVVGTPAASIDGHAVDVLLGDNREAVVVTGTEGAFLLKVAVADPAVEIPSIQSDLDGMQALIKEGLAKLKTYWER